MTEHYPDIRKKVLEALDAGDERRAFAELRAVFDYPGDVDDKHRRGDALRLLARTARAIAGDELGLRIDAAARAPGDPAALHDAADALLEHRLSSFAATLLARASSILPSNEAILSDLVTALEMEMRNADALKWMSGAPPPVRSGFFVRYLFAFNSVMTGDLAGARAELPLLSSAAAQEEARREAEFLVEQIEGMLARADRLSSITPLDGRDLRGWQLVINGSVLLHLSPHGFPDPMGGRYAFVQDSFEVCAEGVARLRAALEAARIRPGRVIALPDRSSAILGRAAAELLGLPLVGVDLAPGDPALIVAYDLDLAPPESTRALLEHHPGQLLWSHAACWTDPFPYAPDVITYLHQSNRAPWGERMVADEETGGVRDEPASTEPEDVLARKIVEAHGRLASDALGDVAALSAMVAGCLPMAGSPAAPGFLRTSGQRLRQRAGGPVPSARFT